MKVLVNNVVKDLTLIDAEQDITSEVIGNADGFDDCLDGVYVLTPENFKWWSDYIDAEQDLLKRVTVIKDNLDDTEIFDQAVIDTGDSDFMTMQSNLLVLVERYEHKRYNKFETVYTNSRHYALSVKAGVRLVDQANYDKTTVKFRRFVYQTFKQQVQMMFKVDVDRNAWIFDQNELKENHSGKESLKSLCKAVYIELEALTM